MHGTAPRPGPGRRPARRWPGLLLYWLAVCVVSVALVIAFVLLLESLDGSSLGAPG